MTRVATLAVLLLVLVAPAATAQTATEWRRGGVCYEVFIRSFFDSNGDGMGDLRGLTQKLDYINDGDPATQKDLGANCIWLMPVAQSPSYHGYDVTNYYAVDPDYGSNEDFKQFVAEAHRRGIRVLFDLVLNHSSSEHPFFRSAVLDANSPYRDWYIWSPVERKMPGWEAPTWHRVSTREEWYYGLFWGGMPDYNLANPAVRSELENVARFWIEEMGVDGFRLDAVSHFFETADGQWKHVAAVHPWLRDYQNALRRIKPDVYTVGEVWDSMGVVLRYYPDQLDANFAFEVADAVFEAVRSGTGARLTAAVERLQREIPDARWGMFLRNHDQTRTLSELQGHVGRNKLAATIMLTLPGLPFVYYGEEIGMTGLKSAGDIRLRTPMHWSRSKAAGFTRATPWEPLAPDSFTANVELQDSDSASLLNLHRKLIHLRAAHPALGSGRFVTLAASDPGVIAYLRRSGDRVAIIVANLTERPIANVRLSSPEHALAAGRYRATPLVGSLDTSTIRITGSGRIQRWQPVRTLAPLQAYVIDLSR